LTDAINGSRNTAVLRFGYENGVLSAKRWPSSWRPISHLASRTAISWPAQAPNRAPPPSHALAQHTRHHRPR